jgi:peptidyl-prolyl cis-trans isomerase C
MGEPNKRIILVQIRLALLLMAAFIGLAFSTAAADDPVVARVNGVEIKESDFEFAASDLGVRLTNIPPEDRRKVLLQYLVENALMASAGESDGLDKADDFPDRLRYHKRRALRDAYYDVKIYDAVTEADAKKVYEEKIGQAKPEQEIHARHILVETEDEAKEVAERLKKGEDFATLANEKSKDPGTEGGDLGFFTRGRMVKPFEDAAFALDVGEVSEPVETPFGWHIIKVEEKRDQPLPSFDQVKEIIIAQLLQKKAQDVVTDLRKAAKIEVVDPELKKAIEKPTPKGDAPRLPADEPSGDAKRTP